MREDNAFMLRAKIIHLEEYINLIQTTYISGTYIILYLESLQSFSYCKRETETSQEVS
jgi:hypothetical protein